MHDEIKAIRTHLAKSGNISYGDPILLHDSSKSRVLLIPFFVPHSDHSELAIKIVTFDKKAGTTVPVENKSISLGEESSRRLLQSLQTHLQVAETGETGSFILIRVLDGMAQLGASDPLKVARALTTVLSQPEIVKHLEQTELSGALL